MKDALFVGLSCPVIGWVFVCILCEPGQIFARFPVWLEKLAPKSIVFNILTCEKCLAGQFALFVYPLHAFLNYDSYLHVFTISLSILIAHFITLIQNKLNE